MIREIPLEANVTHLQRSTTQHSDPSSSNLKSTWSIRCPRAFLTIASRKMGKEVLANVLPVVSGGSAGSATNQAAARQALYVSQL
jgi:hypothetical protein